MALSEYRAKVFLNYETAEWQTNKLSLFCKSHPLPTRPRSAMKIWNISFRNLKCGTVLFAVITSGIQDYFVTHEGVYIYIYILMGIYEYVFSLRVYWKILFRIIKLQSFIIKSICTTTVLEILRDFLVLLVSTLNC